MELVNLTPHPVTLLSADSSVTIPPSGMVARVAVTRAQVDTVRVGDLSIPVYASQPGQVENLPPARPGVLYIVSRVVAEAARDRDDLLVPDDLVRDEQGRIIGARALARV